MKSMIRLAAAAALAFVLAPAASAETVKVGVITTMSGPFASLGQQMDQAIKLYMKLHAKDVEPHKIEIVLRDDTGPAPDVAKRLAQELITRDRVHMLSGVVFTPNAHAIAPLATEAKMPLVIMNAGTSVTTTLSPYFARVSFTLWQSSYPMGQWAQQAGIKSVFTAVTDYGPGHDAEAAFIKGFTEAGGKIAGSVRMPVANPDFVPFIQRAKDANPEAVFTFVPAGRQATAFMKTFAERGMREAGIRLIGPGDITTDEELPSMGDVPLGVVTVHHYSAAHDSPTNKAFQAAWKQEYGANAVPGFMAVGAWDGMHAISHVIKQLNGKIDGDKAMALLKGWKHESPRGPIMIDPDTRDIVQNEYIRRVEKLGNANANIEIGVIPAVKDPWKVFNPPK
ncbi:MAG: branched-chain amino acid ABC transporter substrate-binding protein [Alphaproteobacteria bacterium]|nr:branched-chain amino acid ABC transporter substrate-binding protein [Alphaproteobacteria bacterium]